MNPRRDFIKKSSAFIAGSILMPSLLTAEDERHTLPDVLYDDDTKPDKPVTAIVCGAGNRGNRYSKYGLELPDEFQVVGVAEPLAYRREQLAKSFNIPPENQFVTWEDVFKRPKFADAVIVSTPDALHYGPAMAALNAGYHLLLEKPMAPSWKECKDMLDLATKKQAITAVGHVLRYTQFFRKIKEIVSSGEIGDILSIQHLEPVEHIHYSHSYVRGPWRNSKESNSMIMSKSCHDTDILRWIIDKPCLKTSSFGSLTYFRKENAPAGSTPRCTDGCKVENTCPYSAIKLYYKQRHWGLAYFQIPVLNDETIMQALREGQYGRCVFRCDNDVPDHQTALFEFEGGTTAAFSMEAMTQAGGRRIRIFATKGEMSGDQSTLTINNFVTGKQDVLKGEDLLPSNLIFSGHGGGDVGLMHDFVRAVAFNDKSLVSSGIQASMPSHLMGFKAEESRLKSGKVMDVNM
jgi:predicted dehydrogenase